MASVNGDLSPLSHSDSANSSIELSAKRKRDDSTEAQIHANGTSDSKSAAGFVIPTPEESQALIRDLIDVLKTHDTTPSILRKALPERVSSDEHQAKRHKAEGSTETTTILTRQLSNSYSTVEEVLADIDLAVSNITSKLQLPNGGNQYHPHFYADVETSLKVTAFKKRAHELIQREKKGKGEKTMSEESALTNSVAHMANGGIGSNGFTQVDANSSDNKLALTLYGGVTGSAGSGKQMFSSLQLPTKVNGETKDIVQILREEVLPPGITMTQILPVHSIGLTDDRKRVPTLGELFPTPPSVLPLQPPKPSKTSITRSSTVGWYQPSAADPQPKNGSYSKQSISTGHWLDYSNANASSGTKRKQRDRALSLVGGVKPQLEVDSAESEAAKLEALYRSAYSTFAPSKDNGAAIVPEGMLNRIWWQNTGEKSFERLVQNASYLEDVVAPNINHTTQPTVDDADEEESFRKAVENFEEAIDPNLESVAEKAADEKDINEVLEDISDLLRTLNSHQRNRHMNLNASGRPGGLLNAPDTTSLGTPSKPSEPEISIYEILKSQLTLMIATLPPYAVAKLDSNQLAELAISTRMEIRMDDYNGIMEEDEASARAKAAAFSAASASRPVQPPPHRPSSAALYGNQYAAPRPVAQPQPQYYGQSQTPIRPPPNNLQRPVATVQPPYPSQRPAAGAPYRPNSYGTASYPQQAPRPQQPYTPQYHQHGSNQSYPRPAQSYQGVPQSAPPAAMNPRYAGQPSYAQQSPVQNGVDYRYGNGANTARQASPQKPVHSPLPAYNQAQTQPRPGYGTPTPLMAPDRRTYLQNPMASQINGGSALTPQPPHGPQQSTGYSTFMTAEQQASMMERQRAQIAQQQGVQQMARNAAQAGAMGSPTKSQVNGNAVPAGL